MTFRQITLKGDVRAIQNEVGSTYPYKGNRSGAPKSSYQYSCRRSDHFFRIRGNGRAGWRPTVVKAPKGSFSRLACPIFMNDVIENARAAW
jgi:hypothetical protein